MKAAAENQNSGASIARWHVGPVHGSVIALIAVAVVALFASVALTGCSDDATKTTAGQQDFSPVRIGTMPTEDFLPMWAAEKDGDFEGADVNAELLTFDSAQALSAAIAAGEVDMAMVDIPRSVKLCESGTPVAMEWITLGTDESQGTFGVMAAADAPYSTLKEMQKYMETYDDKWANGGVGVAANTVPEYVFDMLCNEYEIDPVELNPQEVASLPERYSLMASGNLSAAALPSSLLRLGEASGMKLLAEDAEGVNLSQSVMIATEAFVADNEDIVMKVAQAWDAAAESINADPTAYSVLLAEKANLNEAIAQTYPISTYPMALENGRFCHPPEDLVELQLIWMAQKGYTTKNVTYDQSTGTFNVA